MALASMTLRLEAADGGDREEYRIYDGEVEVRQCQPSIAEHCEWHRLSPKELSAHVQKNTVVAKWLEHRLGWRRLLRACTDESGEYVGTAEDRTAQRVA